MLFWPGVMLWALSTTAAACVRQEGPEPPDAPYSVSPATPWTQLDEFPSRPSIRLELDLSLGDLAGPEEQIFGFVTDVGLGPSGELYVVDNYVQRVSVFDRRGRFVERWGRSGTGPGEFLAPFSIAVLDTAVAVYDSRLKRIGVFGLRGAYRHSVDTPAFSQIWLARGPSHSILAARMTLSADTALLTALTSSGETVGTLMAPAVTAELHGPYVAEPGRSCTVADGTILYANSWTYELVRIRWPEMVPLHRWVRESAILRPDLPRSPEIGPAVQRGAVLGLGCGDDHVVLAYADPEDGRFVYDVYSAALEPLGRIQFDRAEIGARIPGWIGDMRGGRIATFRATPYPQVFVYRVVLE
ncbi:MAG: 6-bladed beta-propeller [Gemmatimonadota bacterium]